MASEEQRAPETELWNMFFLKTIARTNRELDRFLAVYKTFTPMQAKFFQTVIGRGVDTAVGKEMLKLAKAYEKYLKTEGIIE